MSNIGKALFRLRETLRLDASEQPVAIRYGMALAATAAAITYLEAVDPGDVDKWMTWECCAECGTPDVAMLDDGGVPYCARHATALRQSEDRDVDDAR